MSDKSIGSSKAIADETWAKLDQQLSAPETKAILDAGQIWSSVIDDYKFACNNGTRGWAQYLVDTVVRPNEAVYSDFATACSISKADKT